MTRRPGFALLAALWLTVVISSVALDLALAARTTRLTALVIVDGLHARAAARAGLAHLSERLDRAIARTALLGNRAALTDPWAAPDSLLPDTVTLGDGDLHYHVRVRDAGTMLDLNRVDEEGLRRFFGALEIDADRADRLAQCIMDWRDPDDLRRLHGAERDDYRAIGARALPMNGPFRRVAELRDVMGMTEDVYDRARPYLIVIGAGRVNINAAARPVLAAMPGMTDEAIAVILRAQADHQPIASLDDLASRLSPGARAMLEAAMPALAPLVTTQASELLAESEGWLDGQVDHARIEALFDRSGATVFQTWERVE